MVSRSLVSYLSLAILGAAIALQFLVPALAGYVFLFLLAWLVLSVVVFLRPGAMGAPGRPTPAAVVGPAPNLPTGLGFCLYCAAPLAPGATECPVCGHALPPA